MTSMQLLSFLATPASTKARRINTSGDLEEIRLGSDAEKPRQRSLDFQQSILCTAVLYSCAARQEIASPDSCDGIAAAPGAVRCGPDGVSAEGRRILRRESCTPLPKNVIQSTRFASLSSRPKIAGPYFPASACCSTPIQEHAERSWCSSCSRSARRCASCLEDLLL